ncbi:MAG: Gfo/Idh/MocA family oxidoreductase [Armatimonadetes bacterium]|nr:Gfo/Idh/MocA family oxidoreductase [Armatimonadota bacterium]
MSHPDYLPTGRPVVGKRRSWGLLPEAERLGVGVVGLHEGHTMLVALRASGLCRAVAGCDLDEAKRADAVNATPGLWVNADYERLLERDDVDIVAIYTPDALHAGQIEAAFKAGKHVLCTKPLVNDVSVAERLTAAAKEHGKRLQVGQSTRFYEPFLQQRDLYEEGLFGEVECFDAHYNHRMDWYYEKSPWTVTETHWAYLGLSHPVDLVRWYLGDLSSVQAVGSISQLGLRYGCTKPDVIAAQFVSKEGKIGRAFGHYGFTELSKGRALIEGLLMGTKGTSLARYPELRHTYVSSDGVEHDDDFDHAFGGYHYRHELKGMHYGEFCNCIDSFAAALLSGGHNSPDLVEGLETVRVMNAVVRSLETGQTVHL